jgi:hypothetical protein
MPITNGWAFQVLRLEQTKWEENAGFRKRPFSETSEVVYGRARENQFTANI